MGKYPDYVARDNGEYGVTYGGEPAHKDSAGRYHHDVYHMRGGLKVDKFHEYNPAQWSPWGASNPADRG